MLKQKINLFVFLQLIVQWFKKGQEVANSWLMKLGLLGQVESNCSFSPAATSTPFMERRELVFCLRLKPNALYRSDDRSQLVYKDNFLYVPMLLSPCPPLSLCFYQATAWLQLFNQLVFTLSFSRTSSPRYRKNITTSFTYLATPR